MYDIDIKIKRKFDNDHLFFDDFQKRLLAIMIEKIDHIQVQCHKTFII